MGRAPSQVTGPASSWQGRARLAPPAVLQKRPAGQARPLCSAVPVREAVAAGGDRTARVDLSFSFWEPLFWPNRDSLLISFLGGWSLGPSCPGLNRTLSVSRACGPACETKLSHRASLAVPLAYSLWSWRQQYTLRALLTSEGRG